MFDYHRVWIIVGIAVGIVEGYSPVEFTSGSTRPDVSGAYDFDDTTTEFLDPDYYNSIEGPCNSNWNQGACAQKLDEAENTIRLLFQTSDRDNYHVYKRLFGKEGETESISGSIPKLNRELLFSNETIFGVNKSGVVSPGIMRNLLTLTDGIRQLQSIARGQKQSVSAAQKQQTAAVKKYASKVKSSAAMVASQLEGLMKRLVQSRTLVQTAYFRSLWDSANATLQDMGAQSDDFLRESQEQLSALAQRYNDWKEMSMDQIASTKTRTQNSLIAMKELIKNMIPALKTRWKRERADQINSLLKETVDDLDQRIAKIQRTIASRFGKVANFLATSIDNSREDFVYNLTNFQDNVQDKLSSLAGKILPDTDDYGNPKGDGILIDKTEREAREVMKARIRAIADALTSLIVPLVKDVQTKLGLAATTSSQIDAFQVQLLNDTATLLDTSRNVVVGLSSQVTASMTKTRSGFDQSMSSTTSSTESQIKAKLDTAKSKLGKIFANIQDQASDTVSTQSMQGATASDTASLSATAAQLTAARQQLAADSASSRLQTSVGLVSASLADATATADEIARNNQNQVLSAQGKSAAEQQAFVDQAHAQVLAQSTVAQSAQQGLQTSFFQSQLAGQDLTASMEQDGEYLDSQLRYQTGQSNQALADASSVVTGAQQGGTALRSRMESVESTAQSSMTGFLSRVSAYQNQAQAQGTAASLSATNSAGSQALNLLGNLGSSLGGMIASSQSIPVGSPAVTQDQMSLSQDVSLGPSRLNSEAFAAQNLVNAKSNQAMIQSVRSLQSTSADSQAALADLMNYNADLIDSKRQIVMSTGGNAVNASLEAAEYLSESGNNYLEINERFLNDAKTLGSQGALNQTKISARLNDTFSELSGIISRFMDKLDGPVANATARLPLDVKTDAAAVIAAIAAKVNATNAAIIAASNGSIDTASLLSTAKNLNEYIDSLRSNFEKQRASFNRFAQQVSLRRIAAMTGLSESVIAQKISVLQSMAQSDGSEAATASRTTDMLQSLQKAIETAKSQSGDTTKISALLSGIGSGVNSFTNNLKNQIEGTGGALSQKSNAATANVGKTLGSLAFNAATSAGSIGNSLLAAMDTVQQSSLAAIISAFGAQKDVFAIAGLLKTLGKSSAQKISQLVSQLQSGNMTMAQAIDAAQEMQKSDITSLYDVLQSLTPYVAGHEAMVNSFLSNLNASANAIISSVQNAISDHEAIEGDVMLDIASNANLLTSLNDKLPNTLNETESELFSKTKAVETLLDSTIFAGTKDGFSEADSSQFDGAGGWIGLLLSPSSNETLSSSSLSQIKLHDQLSNPSGIPSRVVNLKESVVEGQIGVSREQARFKAEIDRDLQAGNNVLKQIIDTVRSTMRLV